MDILTIKKKRTKISERKDKVGSDGQKLLFPLQSAENSSQVYELQKCLDPELKGKQLLKKVFLKVDFFWKRQSQHPSLRTEALGHSGAAAAPGDFQTCISSRTSLEL